MTSLDCSCVYFTTFSNPFLPSLKNTCKKYKIDLITSFDFIDFTLKSMNASPQIIFIDNSAFNINEANSKLIDDIVSNANALLFIINNANESVIDKYSKNTISESFIENIFNDNVNSWNYKKIMERPKSVNKIFWSTQINNLLYEIGFSPKHNGYKYLKDIILSLILSRGKMGALCNTTYPILSAKYKTNRFNVERSIRSAIEYAWNTCEKEHWSKVLNNRSIMLGLKPSNREFIFLCYEKLLHDNLGTSNVNWI